MPPPQPWPLHAVYMPFALRQIEKSVFWAACLRSKLLSLRFPVDSILPEKLFSSLAADPLAVPIRVKIGSDNALAPEPLATVSNSGQPRTLGPTE